jgi:hypothetical protein
MREQSNKTSGGPLISALRVYFMADSDAVEKFIAEPPSPWKTHGHERSKIAPRNASRFKDAWSVVFWAESLGEFASADDMQGALLHALKKFRITYYVVEDVSHLKAERERLEKIRTDLDTGKRAFGITG